MPSINKVRIVGLKYNEQKKKYDDLVFSFGVDDKSRHTLWTLINSGGKGVFLQSLFQPLIPLQEWGSKRNNKIDMLFYNHKRAFSPYTYYVVVEWRLDGSQKRFLLTGIGITAKKGFKKDEEVQSVEYQIFTREYEQNDPYRIERLPLFNRETHTTLPLDEWSKFAADNKAFIQTFNAYSKSRYEKLLETYGIFVDDWREMVEMNRYEAGVTEYFERKSSPATTNHGLFMNLIIPSIDERLSNLSESKTTKNLITLFKEAAKISHKLPLLKMREAAYRKLIELSGEMLQHLQHQQSEIRFRKEHQKTGEYILQAIRTEIARTEVERAGYHEEFNEKNKLLNDLKWQKSNVEYVKRSRVYQRFAQETTELTETLRQISRQLEETKKGHHEAVLHRLLKEKEQVSVELITSQNSAAEIERSEDYQETTKKIEQLTRGATDEWTRVEKALTQTITAYHGYVHLLTDQEKTLSSSKKKNQEQQIKENANRLYLESEKEKFEKKECELITEFGVMFPIELKQRLEEIQQIIVKKRSERDAQEKEINQLQVCCEDLKEKHGEERGRLSAAESTVRELIEKRNFLIEKERNLADEVYLETQCPVISGKSDLDYLREQMGELQSKKEQLQVWIHQAHLDTWNLKFEMEQLHSYFFIPNQEIEKTKQRLEKNGLILSYGTEYLQTLELSDRVETEKNFPLLTYGLVIHEKQIHALLENMNFKTEVFRAPVPIYIAELIKGEADPRCLFLPNKTSELALYPEQWEARKTMLEEEHTSIQSRLTRFTKEMDKKDALIRRTEQWLEGETSEVTGKVIEIKKTQMDSLKKELDKLSLDIERLKKQLAESEEKLQSITGDVFAIEQDIKALEQYEKDRLENDERKTRIAEVVLHLWQLEETISNQTLTIDQLQTDKRNTDDHYRIWKLEEEHRIQQMNDLFASIRLPQAVNSNVEVTESPVFQPLTKPLQSQVELIRSIQKSIEEKNADLAALKMSIKYYSADLAKRLGELDKHDRAWDGVPVPEKSLAQLTDDEEKAKERVALSEKQKTEVMTDLTRAETNAENAKTERTKAADAVSEHGRPPEEWKGLDIDEKEAFVSSSIRQTEKDLSDLNVMIKDTEAKKKLYENEHKVLQSHYPEATRTFPDLPADVIAGVKSEVSQTVKQWIETHLKKTKAAEASKTKVGNVITSHRSLIDQSGWDENLRVSMDNQYRDLNLDLPDENIAAFEHIQHLCGWELERQEAEKHKAEKGREDWAEQASKITITILELLKKMISQMRIRNQNNYSFPLIDLKGGERLPKTVDEVKVPLQEYFEKVLKSVLEQDPELEHIEKNDQIDKMLRTGAIVHAALHYQFPTLVVYNMNTDNSFLYNAPSPSEYKDWEHLNGDVDDMVAESSGGQKVAARTLVAMMLLTLKRQSQSNNRKMVLISDNPFANAISEHILDPIFAVADLLDFQWIVTSPPEYMKVEIIEKFPIYHSVHLEKQPDGRDLVTEQVFYGSRYYQEA